VPNAGLGLGATYARTSDEAQAHAALQQVVPSWNRFLALCAVLEGSLADIAEWLPLRKFSCFTGKEMASLVRALFEDSPKRHNILQSIAEMTT
jgi:hypothetical protein